MNGFKYFFDSNIFLRAIVKDNLVTLEECRLLLNEVEKGDLQATTSNLVLAEIAFVSRSVYHLDKKTITGALKRIVRMKGLKINNEINTFLALNIYGEKSVKLVDAFIASIPQVQNKEMIVVSYDKGFDKLDIIRKEPKLIIKSLKPLKKKKN